MGGGQGQVNHNHVTEVCMYKPEQMNWMMVDDNSLICRLS